MVIEPSWADTYVHFSREPLACIPMTPLGFGVVLLSRRIVGCPVRLPSPTGLITDPAYGGHRAPKDHDVLVVPSKHLRSFLIAVVAVWVDITGRVCTSVPACTAISSVEPVFEELAVAGGQLLDLLVEGLLIAGEAIVLVIAVPGREVETEL